MGEDTYSPNIAIHPGKTLQDILDSIKMSQVDLSQRAGLTTKTINEIIKGKNPITPETAIKLSAVFGMSDTFWNNLQRNYDETKARLKEEEEIKKEFRDLKKFTCYGELAKLGFVKKTNKPREKVTNLQNFFGIKSLSFLPITQPTLLYSSAFRQSQGRHLSNESLAAWLRCGELIAQKISTERYDKEKLLISLNELKLFTREEPKEFQGKLINKCASFGVAIAFVPLLKNTYVNGATRWLNSEKAVIQLSLRGSYEDIFWFTFFHEIAHLIIHGKKEQFVEFKNKRNFEPKEKEADNWACNALIPKSEYSEFIRRNNISDTDIKEFAMRFKVSPSIIAGRLCYEQKYDWKKLTHLRKRLIFVYKNSESLL